MPVLNREYTLSVTAQGSGGEGIAKLDGYALFIPGVISGDTIRAKITKLNKNYGFAELIKVITPSADRAAPPCHAFPLCGGCQLMHMSYESQCRFKQQRIKDALLRIGSIDCPVDFVPAQNPLHYRNKMVFPFSQDCEWGFYRSNSHEVIPLKDCPLGDTLNAEILNCVRDFFKSESIPPYDEITHTGILRRVFIRNSSANDGIMVVVSVNADNIPHREKLVCALRKLSPRIVSVILNINKLRTNLVLGDVNITLWGENVLNDTLLSLKHSISPHSFFQINHEQTELLYKQALEFAEIDKTKTVFDLYCGIGTISLSAASKAKRVIGAEIVPEAIKNARENAKNNNISNAEFYCAAAEDITPKLIADGILPDVVIIDPPRKGSDERTLGAILSANPKQIVYVSCSPATLARDVKFLSVGYNVKKAVGFDLFPQTSHVETVVLLSRNNAL